MAVAAGLPDGMHVAAAGAPERDAAERRRPAAPDAVHDLQRDGVGRAGHALAESLPGAAEDVRHAGPVAAHRSDGCGEGGHRMVEPAEHGARGPGVDARRFRGLVPEEILDDTRLRPAFMQVRSNRVTQAMEGDVAAGPRSAAARVEGLAQALGGDRPVRTVLAEQPA